MPTFDGVVRGFRPLTLNIENVVSTSWDEAQYASLPCGMVWASSIEFAGGEPDWPIVGSFVTAEPI